jgi:hypothetical protein
MLLLTVYRRLLQQLLLSTHMMLVVNGSSSAARARLAYLCGLQEHLRIVDDETRNSNKVKATSWVGDARKKHCPNYININLNQQTDSIRNFVEAVYKNTPCTRKNPVVAGLFRQI